METGNSTAPEEESGRRGPPPGGREGLPLRRWIRRLVVAAGTLAVGAALTWWSSPWIARGLHRLSPDVLYHVDTPDSLVALTLDDGPSRATPRILDVLERHGARATFFVLGDGARRHPALMRRIVGEGHELGSHLYRDRPTWRLSRSEVRDAVDRTLDVLAPYGGTRWIRPGSGWVDEDLVAVAAARGDRIALGSVYPFDTLLPFPGLLAAFVSRKVRPGSVIVLHDGPDRGRRTAEVLDRVLPELRARGYRVVTLGHLAGASR